MEMVLWTFLVRRECLKMLTLKVLTHIFGVDVMRRTWTLSIVYLISECYINKVMFCIL